jgi:hypothetical protein
MKCRYAYSYYQVKNGEMIDDICKRQHLSRKEISYYNSEIDLKRIKTGDVIKLPSNSCCCKNGVFYRIKKNQTIYQICHEEKIDVYALLLVNPYFNINDHIEGQVIILPKVHNQSIEDCRYYTIGHGEDIVSVARKFVIKPLELIEKNPNLRPLEYKEGETIKV